MPPLVCVMMLCTSCKFLLVMLYSNNCFKQCIDPNNHTILPDLATAYTQLQTARDTLCQAAGLNPDSLPRAPWVATTTSTVYFSAATSTSTYLVQTTSKATSNPTTLPGNSKSSASIRYTPLSVALIAALGFSLVFA